MAPKTLLLTETNVPHEENISYFGDGDEAHMVYQFSLPPLLLHALTTQNTSYLQEWAINLKPPPKGCTYFNFTASHDGIGVRPLTGLIPDSELDALVKRVKKNGGKVSMKRNSDGSESPYELNITYFDAFKQEHESLQKAAFLCSQAIALTLQGLPAIYFHSLYGGKNWEKGFKKTNRNRSLNRQKWDYDELVSLLEDPGSIHYSIFKDYRMMLKIRKSVLAFHPDASQ
jgi:sucrose phosphorylase